MELLKLEAEIRQTKGKSAARQMRRDNLLPAVVYGANIAPLNLSLNTYSMSELIRKNGSSGLFINLEVAGDTKKNRTVVLKDIQMDAFSLKYLHVDFQEIDMSNKLSVTVPVETSGESKGVKEGGLLQIIRRELEIYCTPANVPDSIVIDVSDLDVGDAVHVESIDLGDDIEIPHEVNFTVLTVVPPTLEDTDETEEDELLGDVADEADAELAEESDE